jgi:hypothetical protein
MVGLRCLVKRIAAVEAAPGLQAGQAFAQCLGRGQPVAPEQVAVQVLFFGGDVDRGDHPGPGSPTRGRISGARRTSCSPAPGRSRTGSPSATSTRSSIRAYPLASRWRATVSEVTPALVCSGR